MKYTYMPTWQQTIDTNLHCRSSFLRTIFSNSVRTTRLRHSGQTVAIVLITSRWSPRSFNWSDDPVDQDLTGHFMWHRIETCCMHVITQLIAVIYIYLYKPPIQSRGRRIERWRHFHCRTPPSGQTYFRSVHVKGVVIANNLEYNYH
jgi:hypothetical protein